MEEVQQEQPSQPEAVLLSPLAIPKRSYDMAGVSRYRAYRADGTYELVEAHFAAEVPGKCSFDAIDRIERETRHVLHAIPEESVVMPEAAEFIETCVETTEEEKTAFITVDITEVTQSREELFEAFDLSQLHAKEDAEAESEEAQNVSKPEVKQADAVSHAPDTESTDNAVDKAAENTAVQVEEDAPVAAIQEAPIEAKAAPEIPKERIEEPEAELSQDEIEALLNE